MLVKHVWGLLLMPSQKDKHLVHNFIEDGHEIFQFYAYKYIGDSPLLNMYDFQKDAWLDDKYEKPAQAL